MWIVTGTTASGGDQIIITGCAAPPQGFGECAEKFGVAGMREAGRVERRPWRSDW